MRVERRLRCGSPVSDSILGDILRGGGKGTPKRAPFPVGLIGFDKTFVVETQLAASDLPVRLIGARDCRQACSLVETGRVRAVVMGPSTRPHDRTTIESIASRHEARTIALQEHEALIATLQTLVLKLPRAK